MTPLTRSTLTAGTVTLTVTLPLNFTTARRLLGEDWHDAYTYKLERSEDNDTIFLYTLTPDRNPDKPARDVYTGTVNPGLAHTELGVVRRTPKSAFPAHAKRFRVANRVLTAVCAGRADAIAAAGWTATAVIKTELAGRF